MKLETYLLKTIEKAAKNNISVEFTVEENSKLGGYFDDDLLKLNVNLKSPTNTIFFTEKWFFTFLHESCHMNQFIENCPEWSNFNIDDIDCLDVLFKWLDFKIELNQEQLNKYINNIIVLERNCEQRAIDKIKKFKLPLDIVLYTKQANAYIYFYEALKTTRSWGDIKKPFFTNPAILELCSDTLDYELKNKKLLDIIIKELK
jgi:hypothetical protein